MKINLTVRERFFKMSSRIRGAGPGRRVGRLSSPIFADPIPQLALLIRRKNIGELVLKIDHVLCDHHERVIRRAVNRFCLTGCNSWCN
jgi:hypothetical protein